LNTNNQNKTSKDNTIKPYPAAGEKIYFGAGYIQARNIEKHDKIIRGSGAHRAQTAKVENGFLIINKLWNKK
jgi:hypothetical protein